MTLVPKVNPKGTPEKELIEEWETAFEAVREAYLKLYKCYPRACDYPGGAGTADGREFCAGSFGYEKAVREHDSRMGQLSAVVDEVGEVLNALRKAKEEREDREPMGFKISTGVPELLLWLLTDPDR